MPSFAQRMGLRPVRSLVQTNSLDADTRTELWNIMFVTFRALTQINMDYQASNLIESAMWAWEFKKPRDEEPSETKVWGMIKERIITGEWFDALDIIEAFVGYLVRFNTMRPGELATAAVDEFNNVFESQLVGYRFIEHKIAPLDSEVDVAAVSEAIKSLRDYTGARHHLQKATELLADRKNPDYPNSIKESISAVEAVVRKVTNEGTLGAGLKTLQKAGVTIHPALESAWSKMYGWTSDADGIRHGAIEPADTDQAIAKYMLITCSAFVTYLIEAGRKTKLI